MQQQAPQRAVYRQKDTKPSQNPTLNVSSDASVATPSLDGSQTQSTAAASDNSSAIKLQSLPNRFELARNWSLLSNRELLTVTSFVDAKDSVNNWCVGQIVEENHDQGTVRVRFEGWSERHDVILKKNSNKMAPFRSQTFGYTGQRKSAYRDFKLNQAQQIIIEKKVQRILDTKFTCFSSAHECTQFIRGELYFHLDSLLTLEHAITAQDLPTIAEFMKLVFELVLVWMEAFPNYQQAFKECQQAPFLYCIDLPAAISQCCYELVELLGKIWGQCRRAASYFSLFKGQYLRQGPFARTDLEAENGFCMTLTNLFGEVDGFQRIINTIKGSSESVFPLALTGTVLSQFKELPFFCAKDYTNMFASEITQTLMHRLDTLTESEVKEIDRGMTRRILSVLEAFIKIHQPQTNVYEVSEMYELKIAQKLLMSPFFDKKIRGMAEFKDIFIKVENRRRYSEQQIASNDIAVCRFLDLQTFSQWIMQTNILEYIYIENPHSELIKRSLELIYLRAIDKENPLQDSVIEAIWKSATEKHEDIIRASLTIIEEMVPYLSIEKLAKFYSFISMLPDSLYDEMRVDFLEKYTLGALSVLFKHRTNMRSTTQVRQQQQQPQSKTAQIKNFFGGKNKNNQQSQGKQAAKEAESQIDASKYLDLNRFWEISQDTNDAVPHNTRQRALTALINILQKSQNERAFVGQKRKVDFMNRSLENITNNKSMFTSIDFLQRLILTYPRDSQSSQGRNYSAQSYGGRSNQSQQDAQVETRESIVQQLLNQDIFTKLIGNASRYMARVASLEISDARITEAGGIENVALFGDNIPHRKFIDCFIGFIEFIITNSKQGNLSFVNLQALFKTFVSQSISDYEQAVFFKFLTKENESATTRERKFLLDERRRTDVFQKIMCNQKELDCTRLNIEGFRCFKMLLLHVNAEQRHINYNTKTGTFDVINVVHFQSLMGFETLWSITIQSQDQQVMTESRNFLVEIYLKSNIEVKHRKVFVENFLQRIETISEQLNSLAQEKPTRYVEMRLNWMSLIRTYIKHFDYMHMPIEDISKYDSSKNKKIVVILMPDDVRNEIIVNDHQEIWQIVTQISQAFSMRISEFQIVTMRGPLNKSIYDHKVIDYNIAQLQIMRVEDKVLNAENPRRIIGQDKLFLEQLLSLLVQMSDSEKVQSEIVSLLEELPVNIELQADFHQKIQQFPSNNNQQLLWNQLFSWNPQNSQQMPPSTFYNIMLLYNLMMGQQEKRKAPAKVTKTAAQQEKSQPETTQEFVTSFIERGGFQFLTSFFTSVDKSGLEASTVKFKALTMLIEMVSTFLSSKWLKGLQDVMTEQTVFDLFNQNLHVLQNYIFAVERQQREMIPSQRPLSRDTHLISISLQLIQRMMFLYPKLMRVFTEFPNIGQIIEIVFLKLKSERIQSKVAQCFLEICKKLDGELCKAIMGNTPLSSKESSSTAIVTIAAAATSNATEEQKIISDDVSQQLPSVFFMRLFVQQYLNMTLLYKKETAMTKELFSFMKRLIDETDLSSHLDVLFNPQSFVESLVMMIKDRPIIESGPSLDEQDEVLFGILNLLRAILRKRTDIRSQMQDRNGLLNFLLHECLFHKETNRSLVSKDTIMPPKCKSKNTRYACLSLVKELTIDNQHGLRALVDYMRETIYSSNVSWSWRTPRPNDWNIQVNDKQEKSVTGYVGLKNIGCICYMNSIMQQLFMITPFRKAMLEVEDQNARSEPEEENVMFQIKRIFGALQELEKQYFNPKKFCFAFKDIDGSPIDPMVQRDVDEFFNMLIDRIENLIKGTKEEKVMKNLFYGVFANEFICKGCPHYSEREEQFMAIPLQVKNKKSVLEGLESFVEGEWLEGDNAYYCEKCELKRDTLKRCSIKRLPNVLFLELKRFEFNFDTMQKYKVNDYCSFPTELDMKNYSQEHISRQDIIKEMSEKNLTMEDLNSDQTILLNRTVTDEYFKYTLKGVVVHNGTSETGHYYAFIKDREEAKDGEKWYEFNDTVVEHFDPAQIPEECFGGENEHWEAQMQQYQHDPDMQRAVMNQGRNKTKNAYILIYERNEFIDQERFNEFTDDNSIVLQQNQTQSSYKRASQNFFTQVRIPFTVASQIQITPTIHESILQKNRQFWLTRFIFNRQFLEQSLEIFRSGFNFKTDEDYVGARAANLQCTNETGVKVLEDQFEILKYIITFTLTVAFRASIRTQIPFLVRIIRKALQNNVRLSLWLCEIFSNQHIIKEFFIDCTVLDMSRFTAGLLKTAMRTLYEYEKEVIVGYTQQLEQGNIVDYILNLPGDSLSSHTERTSSHLHIQTAAGGNSMAAAQETPTGSANPQARAAGRHMHASQVAYSSCDSVQVITVKSNHHTKLPALVTLINAFLHFQSSPHLRLNIVTSTHLHAVISHFATLGPISRQYLLKTRTLGRLLRLLLTYNNSAPNLAPSQTNEEAFMHQTMPLIEMMKQSADADRSSGLLSSNPEVTHESKALIKERLNAMTNVTSPMVFVIYTISLLVKSCKLVGTQQSQPVSDVNATGQARQTNKYELYNGMYDAAGERQGHNLDKSELELLINHMANRVWWRSSAQELPMVRNAVASLFAYVSCNNNEFSHVYIQEIFKTCAVSNFMVIKRQERPLLALVDIKDAYQRDRITRILNNLYEVLRKNTMYWKQCDQLIELTLKLAKRCREFAIEMGKSRNMMTTIATITRENPSFPYNQGRIKIFRDGIINWQHINKDKKLVDQSRVDAVTNYSKQRLELLNRIVEDSATVGKSQQLSDDSDDDCYGQDVAIGTPVDVFFERGNTGWYPAKVVVSLEEMIKVQAQFQNLEKKQECWVELESQKIARQGCVTKNEKYDNFIYFQELYKLIEPVSHSSQSRYTADSNQRR